MSAEKMRVEMSSDKYVGSFRKILTDINSGRLFGHLDPRISPTENNTSRLELMPTEDGCMRE